MFTEELIDARLIAIAPQTFWSGGGGGGGGGKNGTIISFFTFKRGPMKFTSAVSSQVKD